MEAGLSRRPVIQPRGHFIPASADAPNDGAKPPRPKARGRVERRVRRQRNTPVHNRGRRQDPKIVNDGSNGRSSKTTTWAVMGWSMLAPAGSAAALTNTEYPAGSGSSSAGTVSRSGLAPVGLSGAADRAVPWRGRFVTLRRTAPRLRGQNRRRSADTGQAPARGNCWERKRRARLPGLRPCSG